MLRVSIVLPVLEPCEQFERTLAAVLAHKPADAETIVVHARPYDDPFDLAGEVEFLHAASLKSRTDLANFGALHARGTVLAFVTAPVEFEPGWCEAAVPHFEKEDVFSVAPTILDRERRDRIASAGLEYRCSGFRGEFARDRAYDSGSFRGKTFVGPSLAAGFYRRSEFLRLGGFSPRWGEVAADLDLALRAADLGWISALEPKCRAVAFGPLRSVSAYGAGRVEEEWFWGRQAASPSAWTRFRHRTLLAHELVSGFAAPRRWLTLAGRLAAKKSDAVPAGSTASVQPVEKRSNAAPTVARIDGAHAADGVPRPLAPQSRSERIRLAVRRAERRGA